MPYFLWLKRKVTYDQAAQIQKLDVHGIFSIYEPLRSYPQGNLARNLLGYAGLDDQGLFGLELEYDNVLKSPKSEWIMTKDARGKPLFLQSDYIRPEEPARNIVLTIDTAIQEIAESALHKAVGKAKSKRGFAIVTEPHTGKILALANYPQFTPGQKKFRMDQSRNYAVSDLFEPGSVIKPLVVAKALEDEHVDLDTVFDCENGRLVIDKKNAIRDDHPQQLLTVEDTLAKSSNICTFKIAQLLGKEGLYQGLREFGFGGSSGIIRLPGVPRGRIGNPKKWRDIRFANISFGQGLSVTGLEMAMAYGAIANGGKLMKPMIIEKIERDQQQIVKAFHPKVLNTSWTPKTMGKIRSALEKVASEDGTAPLAYSSQFKTAGKTGTSEKIDPKTRSYSPNMRIASFAGFAPSADPAIVVYVVIDEPQNKPYYGGKWAAPAFREIVEKTLKYLNIQNPS